MGPLEGVRVVEFGAIGPVPMAAMLLAEMGAEVIRLERARGSKGGIEMDVRHDLTLRSRPALAVDLKSPDGLATAHRLCARADILLEGYRPGVMERLGLGPEALCADNPGLVYGRMTGWGQEGPLAQSAGHDINYIALVGALAAIGQQDAPLPPLNLVGDYGGGALYLALGVLAALIGRARTGRGQVVDAAMVDGAASLMTVFYGLRAAGDWQPRRAANLLDGGAPFYGVYGTSDGRHIAIGPLEPQFWSALVAALGWDEASLPDRADPASWPELRRRLRAAFASASRDTWCARLEGTDVCFAPVLDMDEAPGHPHLRARGTFVEVDGIAQPSAAPRFSETPSGLRCPPLPPGGPELERALTAWGFDSAAVTGLTGSSG
ncbi:MAG: CoA transferase [Rhodobacteraceae bacterium]|nr:CoA transferase [Paracoccaceae bacterium]